MSYGWREAAGEPMGGHDEHGGAARRAAALVAAFEPRLGVYPGLAVRVSIPLLYTTFASTEEEGWDLDLGDMALGIEYEGVVSPQVPLRVGLSAGVSIPTGGSIQGEIPANAAFVSGTVDPVAGVRLAYDFEFGLGADAFVLARLPVYAADGFQAGATLSWGASLRFTIARTVTPSIGFTALNRARDRTEGAADPNTGGDFSYLTAGLSLTPPWRALRGHWAYCVVHVPMRRRPNGAQLEEVLTVTAGLGFSIALWRPRPPAS